MEPRGGGLLFLGLSSFFLLDLAGLSVIIAEQCPVPGSFSMNCSNCTTLSPGGNNREESIEEGGPFSSNGCFWDSFKEPKPELTWAEGARVLIPLTSGNWPSPLSPWVEVSEGGGVLQEERLGAIRGGLGGVGGGPP